MTPKQIKFFKSYPIMLLVWVLLGAPIISLFYLYVGKGVYSSIVMQAFVTFVIFFPILLYISPKYNKIYEEVFNILESEQNLTLIQAIKLSIKRCFCSHSGYEAKINENPSPLHFLDIKAKCIDCGAENYEINKRAYEAYKLRLADNILFQRNIEKFPEFYKDKAAHMDLNRGKKDE